MTHSPSTHAPPARPGGARRRRRRLWVGVAAAALMAAFLTTAAVRWARDTTGDLRRRAIDRIEETTGLDVSIGGVQITAGDVEVRDIRLRGRAGGVLVSVPRATLTVDPAPILDGQLPAVQTVVLRSPEAVLDPTDPGWKRSTATLRRRLATVQRHGEGSDGTARSDRSRSRWIPDVLVARGPAVRIRLADGAVRRYRGDRCALALPEGAGAVSFRCALDGDDGSRLDVGADVSADGVVDARIHFEAVPLSLVAGSMPAIPWHRAGDATAGGALEMRSDSATSVGVDGTVTLTGLGLASDRLAPGPIENLDATIRGAVLVDFDARRIVVEPSELSLDGVELELAGEMARTPQGLRASATVELGETACQSAVDAIPGPLLGELAGLELEGTIGGRLGLEIHSDRPRDAALDLRVDDRCRFVRIPPEARLDRFRGPFEISVYRPDGSRASFATGPGTARWVPVDRVSPYLIHAVLAHEDAAFFRHQGFAPWAIETAVGRNLDHGGFAYGASTIPMQLAKNLFLHREKTVARKVQEALLTWWLERRLGKRAILELYLNVIEYGPSLYGVRAAARHYFARRPSELSPAESVFLAEILPDPVGAHHLHVANALTSSMRARLRRSLEHLERAGRIDEDALRYGLAELERFEFAPEPPHRPTPTASRPDGRLRVIPGTWAELPFEVAPGFLTPDSAPDRFETPLLGGGSDPSRRRRGGL